MKWAWDKTMDQPLSLGREYGTNIYYDPKTETYSYTPPQTGPLNNPDFQGFKNLVADPNKHVGDAHSHYKGLESRPSDIPRPNGPNVGDVPRAKETGKPQYNVGADGDMWRANPNGTVTHLGNVKN